MSVILWDDIYKGKDACLDFEKNMNVLVAIYDECCPLKYVNHRKDIKRKPWMTQEIIDLIEVRNNAYKTC